jgi:hypothetical protein
MPKRGLVLPRQLVYEQWLRIGRQLAEVSSSSAWCLGDWLAYGEDTYSGRYRDAIEQTSLDYQTLRNYAWVAGRFMLSRRRDGLSFAHHAEVAGLSEHEQDFWLGKAEKFSWSRNKLRQEVRASLAERRSLDGRGAGREGDHGRSGAQGGENTGDGPEAGYGADPFRQADEQEFRQGVAVVRIKVKLSADQLESWKAAAGRLGHSIEEWAALVLDAAARKELSRLTAMAVIRCRPRSARAWG